MAATASEQQQWTILGRTLEMDDAFSARCFARAYEALHVWVESTLESARVELWLLLFPVFAHAYLRIVAGETESRSVSRAFLERWSPVHSTNELWGALSDQDGKLAERLLSGRYCVRLGAVAAELVGEYLTRTANVCVIQLINDHVRLEVVDAPTTAPTRAVLEDDEGGASEVVVAKGDRTAAGFLDELWLGALGDSAIDARRADSHLPRAFLDADADSAANEYARALLTLTRRPGDRVPSSRASNLSALEPTALALTLINGADLSCLKASRDARRLAAGFADACVRVYKVDELVLDERHPPPKAVAHRGPVYSVDWERDARYLLSAGADGSCMLWDTQEGGRALCRYRAHAGGPCWDAAFADLARGRLFATAGADQTARVFATDRVESVRIFVGHWAEVSKCSWHPNAHYLLTGAYDHQCRLWDVRGGKCCRVLDGAGAPVSAVDVSPDGKFAAAGCVDGSIHIWHLDSAKLLGSHRPPRQLRKAYLPPLSKRARRHNPPPADHNSPTFSFPAPPVYATAFSADGAALAAGGQDMTLRLFASVDADNTLTVTHSFHTKATPIFDLTWTNANLCLLAGPLRELRPLETHHS